MAQESSATTAQRIVRFLDDNGTLTSDSPWQSCDYETSEVAEVDYRALMQDPGEEIWSLELPREFVDDIASALGDKRELEIGRRHTLPSSASETPWDLCAWYQPIHFHPSDWGIYIKEDCLLRLAVAIALSVDQQAYQAEKAASRQAKYWRLGDAGVFARAAFVLLFLHEHYHHRIECLGVRLHVVTRKGLYVPYVRGVYSPSKGTDDLLEEALANACMYLRIDEATYKDCLPQTVREAMKALLRSRFPYEPPGYRLAVNYLDQPRFDAGENRLQGWVRETSMSPVQPSWEWDVAPRMTQSFLHIQSNIYTVVPRGRKHHLPTTYFPYSCSTEQMVSICRKRGYQEVPGGGKGAHRKFTKAGAPPVILPPRKDLSIGVIKNTLAAIGGYRLKDLPNLMR